MGKSKLGEDISGNRVCKISWENMRQEHYENRAEKNILLDIYFDNFFFTSMVI